MIRTSPQAHPEQQDTPTKGHKHLERSPLWLDTIPETNSDRDIHAQITPTHANTHPPRDPDLLTHTVTSTTPVTETHRVTETHSVMDTYSHICMYVHIPAAETQRSAHIYKEEVSSLIPNL